VLPTEDEIKQLAVSKKNGEQQAYQRHSELLRRLRTDIGACSAADFQTRKDAVAKLNTAMGWSSMSSDFEYDRMGEEYILGSRSPQEFAERAKAAKIRREFRPILHKYITGNPTTYPGAREKMLFCDWLKAQGLTYTDIEEYKKDLLAGNDPGERRKTK
jgi:hypothetical protein